jgi:hypothetical protein
MYFGFHENLSVTSDYNGEDQVFSKVCLNPWVVKDWDIAPPDTREIHPAPLGIVISPNHLCRHIMMVITST